MRARTYRHALSIGRAQQRGAEHWARRHPIPFAFADAVFTSDAQRPADHVRLGKPPGMPTPGIRFALDDRPSEPLARHTPPSCPVDLGERVLPLVDGSLVVRDGVDLFDELLSWAERKAAANGVTLPYLSVAQTPMNTADGQDDSPSEDEDNLDDWAVE